MVDQDLDFRNDRDATLKLIDWFEIDRVHSARVAVVGSGAIGNEVLKNLALLGVGHIYIFDRDTIEASNLSRSILFRASDQDQPKALVAAKALKQINSNVRVYWFHGDFLAGLGEGLLQQMDVVIGCLDSMPARRQLNLLCMRVGKPWIDAGIGSLRGQVRVYLPDGPCYACLYGQEMSTEQSCGALAAAQVAEGRIPTTPTMASLVAAIQVQEFLKLLNPASWADRSLAGREFVFEGAVPDVEINSLPTDEDCPAHGDPLPAFKTWIPVELRADSTADELLRMVEPDAGPGCHIYLQDEILLERCCPNCGTILPIFRPLSQVKREELDCECGQKFRWTSDVTTTHHIQLGESSEGLLATRLSDLGIPYFGLVNIRATAGTSEFVLLSGDRDRMSEQLERT